MADETTGVNYGLLGPHSGTQFKPTSLKDVEQYMRDVRELKRKKAEERGLQALQTGGIDAMRKSLVSDGFGELAEPMERQVAQARQQEILSTLDNVRKVKLYEELGLAPQGTTDKLFNSKQVEVPSQSIGMSGDSRTQRANPLTPKIGMDEAVINAPATLPAPAPVEYRKEGAQAASQLSQDLYRVPYVDPNAPPESKPARAFNWAFSDSKNPISKYEPQAIQTTFNLSAVPSPEVITDKIYERAEKLIPKIDKWAGTPDEVRVKEEARKAAVDKLAIELGDDLRKKADTMRSTSLSDQSAKQGLAAQGLGIESQKREAAKSEREKLNRTPWSPSNPSGNIFILTGFDSEKIITPEQTKLIQEKAILGKRLDTDYKVAQKAKFKGLGNMMSLAESALRSQGTTQPTITAKLEWANQMGWIPTREEQGQIERMMDKKSFSVWSDTYNKIKGSFGIYGSPADSGKISEQLNPIFEEITGIGADINYGSKKQDAKSAVEAKGVGAKKEDKSAAPKSDKSPRKPGESYADYLRRTR